MAKKLTPADLDATTRIDDRWTLDKLRRAGYDLEWERTCKTCGDEIECYARRPANGGRLIIVLNAVVLTPHHCDGR